MDPGRRRPVVYRRSRIDAPHHATKSGICACTRVEISGLESNCGCHPMDLAGLCPAKNTTVQLPLMVSPNVLLFAQSGGVAAYRRPCSPRFRQAQAAWTRLICDCPSN